MLEVKEDRYASRLGAERVEVLDIDPLNSAATVVGDVCEPTTLPRAAYDAAVVTQVLQFVRDPVRALDNLGSSLRAGGTILLTVPAVSRVDGTSDRWRWTPQGLTDTIAAAGLTGTVVGMGNALACRAFLFGAAVEDVEESSLDVTDPDQPLVVGAVIGGPEGTGAHQ
ncbi:methyltransferase domain-containing protein [Kineococcus rhizosphaerae]|uniref:methyltransferase domain-containing protein n=1 Tax=Kineococcus rhizosphaerae TaxID=559628 RepID=UPI000D075F14|nr:methyltransferase domain-containing protein [Kineococcus rhizosphaerae]